MEACPFSCCRPHLVSVTIQENFVLQQPEHRPRDLRVLPARLTAADIRPLPMEEVDTAFRPESSNKAELRSKPVEKTIKLRHSELGDRSG